VGQSLRRYRPEVEERHRRIVELRDGGMLLKNIARTIGVHHATVIHHLKGDCRCNCAPSLNHARHPWAATAFVLQDYGPLRLAALARIAGMSRQGVKGHLEKLEALGIARQREDTLWEIRETPPAQG